MKRRDTVHHGSIEAIAFVLGPESMSELEAHRRVLTMFTSGSRLLQMPDDRWLLVLPQPVRLFAEAAPGLPFVLDHGRWVASPDLLIEMDVHSGGSRPSGALAWFREGRRCEAQLDALTMLDPSQWLDLGVPILDGLPLQSVVVPSVKAVPVAPLVDLRSLAGLGDTPDETKAMMQSLQEEARRARNVSSGRRSPTIDPFGKRLSARPPSKLSSAFAKLLLKSPASKSISKKHEQYLNDLRVRFESGDFENALKRAIPFGGKDDDGGTVLGTPGARQQLTFGSRSGGAGMVPYGAEVSQMLAEMYRSAAADLESQERYFEAAYVLGELMDQPMNALSMLERNKQWKLAAELARSYEMDADVLLRLQWLAGDKAAAVRTARRHGNYASVMAKVAAIDPQAAKDLRVHWINDLELSGRYVQAVEVGWVEPDLRPLLRNVIAKAAAMDDSARLSMQAYDLHLNTGDDQVAAFERALHDDVESDGRGMRQLVLALSSMGNLPNSSVDRRVASSVLRSVFLMGSKRPYDQQFTRATKAMIDRSDPLLKADLGPFQEIQHRAVGPIELPGLSAGLKPVHDVAMTATGDVLVAFGETGCSLVSAGGQTKASWSIPTHALVMSDSGTMALLLTQRDSVTHVYILDLATRKTRLYGSLSPQEWADSFDGASWAVQFNGTLAFLDMFAAEATLGWLQFENGEIVHCFARNAEQLSAIVTSPVKDVPTGRTQVFRWSLPIMNLNNSQDITVPTGMVRLSSDGSRALSTDLRTGTQLWQTEPGKAAAVIGNADVAAGWNAHYYLSRTATGDAVFILYRMVKRSPHHLPGQPEESERNEHRRKIGYCFGMQLVVCMRLI
jgi:hypothetical protein